MSDKEEFGVVTAAKIDDNTIAEDSTNSISRPPDTNPNGRMSNEDLRDFFIARDQSDAEEQKTWRADHDSEANNRNAALMTAISTSTDEQRKNFAGLAAENRDIRARLSSLEITGVPLWAARIVVASALLCVVAMYGELGLRWYSVLYAPVIHLAKP